MSKFHGLIWRLTNVNREQWFTICNPRKFDRDPTPQDACCEFKLCGISGKMRAHQIMWINNKTDAHFYSRCEGHSCVDEQRHKQIKHIWRHLKEVTYGGKDILSDEDVT